MLVKPDRAGGGPVSAGQNAISDMGACSCWQSHDPPSLWSLFDDSSTRIAQLNLQLRLVGGNAGFADVFGLPAEALPGHALVDLVHASVRDKLTQRLQSLVHGERSRFTDRVMTATGTRRIGVELAGIAVTVDAGRVDSLIILVQPDQAANAAAPYPVDARRPLTRMDALVLEGVAAGMSTVQLAAKLFLSQGGVEYHVNALMKNLKAANRSELVSKAYSAGLFGVGSWPPRVISDFIE
jgi:DNA-binding CsgD family transcriptional regulator